MAHGNCYTRWGVAGNYRNRLETGLWDAFEGRLYYQHKKDTRRFFEQNRRGWAITDTFVVGVQASTPPGRHPHRRRRQLLRRLLGLRRYLKLR